MLPPLSTGFEPVSPGVTPALSLILAHAPDLNPLPALVLPLCQKSLQVAARPCWNLGPSQRYLRESFPRCLDPYPGGSHWCTYPFLPRGQRPSPHREWLGTQQSIRTATSVRSGFSGLQSFANVQASRFARHPGCSHRIKVSLSGQPWLLLPRISRFVTSPSSGYASRPKSGN